ncbi:flap endonuclease-1 [Desulfurococcus mucosus]|uniref:Flap endonuclease 1 n=1 Tax=Desulfurococcus mucosus (strain ATCC 35584 / DSM 2162 / JCM 9187 / O7/1) TaxID=765177 RepID=E8RA79_DESM0|nr:flap endonuclease-1 [Desulfurococcus mucosus]ADV65385.1 flap endonuclease 1 [Desulfurococcus mucosus DSM 2162]
MGVDLRELIPDDAKIIIEDLRTLRGRVIAIDGYNALYQFLAAIRQPDGTPLMDGSGRITSHLSGLFYRTINIVEAGIKPVYVFDGKPPELKAKEIERRRVVREEAARKYEEAVQAGDLESARRYAMMSARLTDEMVRDAKALLDAMGIPWVQAPAEGEAQAAYMARKGDAYASASQDYDSLLFGSPRLVRNLTISGRRKLPRREEYVEVKPEVIELDKLLSKLGVTYENLVDIGILLGTDYNPDGFEGIGPKKALQLVKVYGSVEKIPKPLLKSPVEVDVAAIKKYFLQPQVTDNYRLEWRNPDPEAVKRILVGEHDFSAERVNAALDRYLKAFRENIRGEQKGLSKWFAKPGKQG